MIVKHNQYIGKILWNLKKMDGSDGVAGCCCSRSCFRPPMGPPGLQVCVLFVHRVSVWLWRWRNWFMVSTSSTSASTYYIYIYIYIHIIHAYIYIYIFGCIWMYLDDAGKHIIQWCLYFSNHFLQNHTVRNRFLGTKFSSWAEENHSESIAFTFCVRFPQIHWETCWSCSVLAPLLAGAAGQAPNSFNTWNSWPKWCRDAAVRWQSDGRVPKFWDNVEDWVKVVRP